MKYDKTIEKPASHYPFKVETVTQQPKILERLGPSHVTG